jgi:hypothetical protein
MRGWCLGGGGSEAPKLPEVKDLRDVVAAGIEELFDATVRTGCWYDLAWLI